MKRRVIGGALAVGLAASVLAAGCGTKKDSSDAIPAECHRTDTSAVTYPAPPASSNQIAPQAQVNCQGVPQPVPDSSTAANPAGNGDAHCKDVSIAMAGALTGPDAALGINVVDGVKLALDIHNKANPGCQVQLRAVDTEGNPQKATQVIPNVITDQSVIGLVGPAFSGETKATGKTLSDAGLASLSASATNAKLTDNGWKTFFRGLANDDYQGPALGNYLLDTVHPKKVCIVDDSTEYGVGLASTISQTLGSVVDPSCAASVKKGDKDFSATVAKINAAKPDVVFFGGYYTEGAGLVSQLRAGGVNATFAAGDGTNDPEFVKQAGSAASQAVLSCPCGPAPTSFTQQYQALNGQAPGVYSVEAYDLATILLKGIDSGVHTRADMVNYVRNYDGNGLARHYKWNDNGELANALVWMYKVK